MNPKRVDCLGFFFTADRKCGFFAKRALLTLIKVSVAVF